jgi:4-amino-4-deoxy-L-arabinose transferase-like glycosyltransferase
MLSLSGPILFVIAVLSAAVLALIDGKPDWKHFGEIPRIAASVAEGHGFSSPFMIPTGPSALEPPFYPYLLAAIFRVFGVFTLTSYGIAVAMNILAHAISCVLLYRITKAVFGNCPAIYASTALATFPLIFQPLIYFHMVAGFYHRGMFITPVLIWNTTFSELVILSLIWMTLRRAGWLPYGVLWGVAALLNPTILAVMPFFFAWRVWHKDSIRDLLVAAAVMVLCVSPWLIRNYVVFHQFIFIRDGLGLEIRNGNQPGGGAIWNSETNPDININEARKVAQMGELSYVKMAGQQSLAIIRSNPRQFVVNCLMRIRYYWIGTPVRKGRLRSVNFIRYIPPLALTLLAFCGGMQAVRKRNRPALLLFAVLLFYPAVYYISHTFFGFFYQYPIQAEMLALAAGLF